MRIVISHRAIGLAEHGDCRDATTRALEACHHIGDFLAQSGRTGRLAVRMREHGGTGLFVGDGAQAFDDRIQARQHDFIARRL